MTFFLISCTIALGQDQLEYAIQIRIDGSTGWVIKRTGTNIQLSPDSFTELRDKVQSLEIAAENMTGRRIIADNFRVTADVSGSYTVVRYQFDWKNFSKPATGNNGEERNN